MNSFYAVDFEAANNKWDICQVGVTKVENGIVTNTESHYVKPPGEFWRSHTRIHGITKNDVRNAFMFKKMYSEILEPIKNEKIIFWDVASDRKILKANMNRHGMEMISTNKFECAQQYARLVSSFTPPNYKLKVVAEYLGLSFRAHDAGEDSYVTAMIYLHCMDLVNKDPSVLLTTKQLKQIQRERDQNASNNN